MAKKAKPAEYVALPAKLWPVFLAAEQLERAINPKRRPFGDRLGRRSFLLGTSPEVMVRLGGIRDFLDRILLHYGCENLCDWPESQGGLPSIKADAAEHGFPDGVEDFHVYANGLKRQPIKLAAEVGTLALRLAVEIRLLSAESEQTVMLDSIRGAILFSWRTPITLGDTEEKVLEWLVRLKTATITELRDKAGCDGPGRVIRRIIGKCPELEPYWLSMPGKKGAGGYSTRIELK